LAISPFSADPADGKGERVREDITISQGQERSKLQEPERGKQTKKKARSKSKRARRKQKRQGRPKQADGQQAS